MLCESRQVSVFVLLSNICLVALLCDSGREKKKASVSLKAGVGAGRFVSSFICFGCRAAIYEIDQSTCCVI